MTSSKRLAQAKSAARQAFKRSLKSRTLRAQFDRPRGTTPEQYSALVGLEGLALSLEQVQAHCVAFKLSARTYDRSSGVFSAYVYPDGSFLFVP